MNKQNKELILGIIVVLLGAFFWWFLRYIFYVGNLTIGCWILGGVLFILFGVALCLAMLLINNKTILFGSFVLTAALFFVFFNNELFYYFIAILILMAAFAVANKKIRKEEKVQVNLDFWRIWKRGLPWLITILCLVIALVYYFSPEPAKFQQKEIQISRSNFNLILRPLEGLISKRLPKEIGDLNVEAIQSLNKEQIKDLKNQYNIEVKKGDTIKDVLYKLVNFQLNTASVPYKKFIPFGLAVGLFITLKIISILYVAMVIMLSWLILKILIVLKFVRLEKIQKEVETVKL
jgi:hypothetical protein